ncbi:hypothetical protein [Acinetobacter lwoffii]|uniref:hypothetical protein n=1 Tax=Acinetobacter lwoffii TaxID=28090 RepID=UPI0019A2250E|nr:hypothetical protein [Acinetobacter lwoffii]MBC9710072.1 hypothetical protein [Enterococcus sp.]MCO8083712.1 hypothetical protein [Acinetobacter lwoffii]
MKLSTLITSLLFLSPITYAQHPMDRLNDLMNSATPQKITDEDEVRTYVKRVTESLDFMERYKEAAISYKDKNGYTKQELNDYQCNKLYMMDDLIAFQNMYSNLAYVPEIKSINQNTIELREEVLKNVKRYNFKCTNELINIPLDTSKL